MSDNVIHVDFKEKKRLKTLREIYEAAGEEFKKLDELNDGHEVIPEHFIMPLPNDGLDHD